MSANRGADPFPRGMVGEKKVRVGYRSPASPKKRHPDNYAGSLKKPSSIHVYHRYEYTLILQLTYPSIVFAVGYIWVAPRACGIVFQCRAVRFRCRRWPKRTAFGDRFGWALPLTLSPLLITLQPKLRYHGGEGGDFCRRVRCRVVLANILWATGTGAAAIEVRREECSRK